MIRTLNVLQPAMSSLLPPEVANAAAAVLTSMQGANHLVDFPQPLLGRGLPVVPTIASRTETAFDRARAYYALLTVPVEEVLRQVSERPSRFDYTEWFALLQVRSQPWQAKVSCVDIYTRLPS